MAERLKWRSKRPDVEAKARELDPSYRDDFMQAMKQFGIVETQICDELGVEVSPGQEWRVEETIEKYGSK